MRIETIIKDAFEKSMERYQAEIPPFPQNVPIPQIGGKQRERYGALIAAVIVSVSISLFSSQTGMFKSSLVVPWADIVKLLPKNPAEAFLGFLQAINSSV
ncbi:MAG: hypothetical protein LBD58_05865 [Treponema sp.]|jgi:hypothetical protein|nr:hypothetical protein [Treponema sp.]